jgi:hypothetical protein
MTIATIRKARSLTLSADRGGGPGAAENGTAKLSRPPAVPQKADVVLTAANGSFVPILLQKSFCTGDQKFSGL